MLMYAPSRAVNMPTSSSALCAAAPGAGSPRSRCTASAFGRLWRPLSASYSIIRLDLLERNPAKSGVIPSQQANRGSPETVETFAMRDLVPAGVLPCPIRPPERGRCPGAAPARAVRPGGNDLDWAGHRHILEGGRSAGMSGRLPGRQRPLVVHRGHHLAGGVPAVGVVVLDPGRHPGPGCCPGGEVLRRAELEFQGGVPGFDDGVVQG